MVDQCDPRNGVRGIDTRGLLEQRHDLSRVGARGDEPVRESEQQRRIGGFSCQRSLKTGAPGSRGPDVGIESREVDERRHVGCLEREYTLERAPGLGDLPASEVNSAEQPVRQRVARLLRLERAGGGERLLHLADPEKMNHQDDIGLELWNRRA